VLQGRGFVPWRPFVHPDLGAVRLGGWRPYARTLPPAAEVDALVPGQVQFLLALASKLPRVAIESVKVREMSEGLFEVSARVVNRGEMPTALAQGGYTRRRSPINVELSADGMRFLGDEARRTVESLDGRGGSRDFRWLLLGPRGAAGSIEVRLRRQVLARVRLELTGGGSL
jgi:hypothetical protein